MKISKMITIDEELSVHLKKVENISGLINDLLIEHFNASPSFQKQRIMKRIEILKQQKKELEIEEKRLSEEVEKFLKSGKEKREIVENVKPVETHTHEGHDAKQKLSEGTKERV